MSICKIREKRKIQLYQKIKQTIDELTGTTAAICIFEAIKDNVSTTQLNQIFIGLSNNLGGKNGNL